VKIAINKIRDSAVSVVTQPALKDLGLNVGHYLTLSNTRDGKGVLTFKSKYVLADLIAQCHLRVPVPADLGRWDAAHPVGQEVPW
jgi:antitoxin ChpS